MDLDLTAYSKRNLSSTFTLYWRILKEQQELEVVMVVNGTSYVGLGWRPRHLTASCRNFPYLEDPKSKDWKQNTETAMGRPEPESHPEPSGKPEPTSEPEPSSKPEPTSEPEPSSEPEPTSEPEPSSEPGPRLLEPEPRTMEKAKHSKVVSSRETKNYNSSPATDKDVTVETSVSFRVSSSQGKSTASHIYILLMGTSNKTR
jgi:hypothetical protein